MDHSMSKAWGPHTTIADIKAATTANKNAVSSREAMTNWLNKRLAMYLGRVRKPVRGPG